MGTNVANLHQSPDSDSELISQLIHGARVSALETSGSFTKISGPDLREGWIRSPHLSPPDYPALREASRTIVPIGLVHVHPDSGSEIMTRLPLGAHLYTSACVDDDGWLEAALLPQRTGFLKSENITTLVPFAYPGREDSCAAAVKWALSLIGTPYLWGGTTPFGIDCSGLVQLCFGLTGIEFLRDAEMQRIDRRMKLLQFIDNLTSEGLERGDLLFLGSEGRPPANHVMIAIGDGTFIHSQGGFGVRIDSCALPRYAPMFLEARRLLTDADPTIDGA